MREIKFRGWDDEKKIMLEPQDLSQSGEYWPWLGKKDVKIMQFTGLNDTKGNEIYEGDIVKYTASLMPLVEETYEAVWCLCGFGFKKLGEEDHCALYLQQSKLEVIGNVYENPELVPSFKP